ncbi:MAG: hypothetical protein A2Y28_05150 [Chlamydiae bacterium GWC2_50_10]|nr:MAG: hypothetical protein A2Y28_05150 [Chlamydiae bacterium GWC2_50_10]
MFSFDVLDRNLKVEGGLFLEASAGTGKTFAIQHLVLRLLLEKEAPLTLDQILVVTFTRAATRELKRRIRSHLEAAHAQLSAKSSEWDYLNALLESGEERVYEAAKRVEAALLCFEEAPIFTIHGFCHRLLKETAFEAGVGLDLYDSASDSLNVQWKETLFDAFRTELCPPSFSASQIRHLLSRGGGDLYKLADELYALIQKDKEIPLFLEFGELFVAFRERIAALSRRFLLSQERLLVDFQTHASCYKEMTGPAFKEQMELLSSLLEKGEVEKQEFDACLRQREFFLEKMVLSNKKARSFPPSTSALHYPGLAQALNEEILPLISQGKDPRQLLLRLASGAHKRMEALASEQEELSPDALLKKTEEALCDPEILIRVREKFRAVIMDEFQDTDPIQWRIVKRLYRPEASPSLYLVGDPKQAIYGFRKADVYSYLLAASLFSKKRHFFLTTNYRSEPSLIHALNTLFSYTKSWLPLPAQKKALSCPALSPAPGKSASEIEDGKKSVHFFLSEGRLGREGSWPTLQIECDLLFPFLAEEAVRLHKEREIPLEQMAFLVKDRFQAERLQLFFHGKNIPAVLKRKQEAARSLALLPMKELLEAAWSPGDLSALKRALGSSLFLWDLQRLISREEVARIQPFFFELKEAWREGGVGLLYERVLQSGVLERLLAAKELTLYADLQLLAALLMEKEAQESLQPQEVIKFLRRLKNEEEKAPLPASPALGGVQILTLHMSKGLEFEVVFALALASRHLKLEEFVSVKEKTKEWLVTLSLDPRTKSVLLEKDAEKLRQLYVALTRAKRRVYIPVVLDEGENNVPMGTASPLEIFLGRLLLKEEGCDLERVYALQLPLARDRVFSLLDDLKASAPFSLEVLANKESPPFSPASLLPSLIPPDPFAPAFPAEPVLSFSSLTRKEESASAPFKLPSATTLHALPPGAETGVLLHALFDKIFLYELYSPYAKDKIRLLVENEIAATALQGLEEEVCTLIQGVFHLPLLDGREAFSLSQLRPGEVLSEFEFVHPSPRGLIKGFIDLAFLKEGKYYLLDWKSNFLGEDDEAYAEEKLRETMEQKDYFFQASLYAGALKRYLELFDPRPFKEIFGGALYLFVRAKRVYRFFPNLFSW